MWSASSSDADLDVAEMAVALLDQVGEPAGAGDYDVDPVAQRGDLRASATYRRRWWRR